MPVDKKPKQILLISVQNNLSVIGLRFIHYFLLKNDYPSLLLHLPHFNSNDFVALEILKDFVSKLNLSFIGLSLMTTEFNHACDISKYLKKHFPAIPIIWGGVHPTIAPESCFPFVDYACIGEGERTVLNLADAFRNGQDIRKIPNLCYKDGGSIKKNPLYPLLEDLDGLPFLDHIPRNSFLQKQSGKICMIDKTLFKREARYQGKIYEITTSRGCAFSCTYCCNNVFFKLYGAGKIRRRSVKNIISELEIALKDNPEIAIIHIQDDSFMSCSNEYIKEFSTAYKRKINKPLAVHTIPIYVNHDKIRFLKEAGIAWLNMGLQSGSDRVCRDIYKRNSLKKDFLKGAELIKRFKIAGKYDVILDNPFETEQDQLETIETLMETPKPFLLQFFSLTLYLGTELYQKVATECPEKMVDYYTKNFHHYENNTLNGLTVLAAFLPKVFMRMLLRMYRTNPRNLAFRAWLLIFKILSTVYYKPLTSIKVLKLAYGNSYIKAARDIPMYLKEASERRLGIFAGSGRD